MGKTILTVGYTTVVKLWADKNNIRRSDLKIVHNPEDVLGYSRDMPIYLVGDYWEVPGYRDIIEAIQLRGYKTETKRV